MDLDYQVVFMGWLGVQSYLKCPFGDSLVSPGCVENPLAISSILVAHPQPGGTLKGSNKIGHPTTWAALKISGVHVGTSVDMSPLGGDQKVWTEIVSEG